MNELQALIDSIKSLTDIDEAQLSDEVVAGILNNTDEQFNPQVVSQSINQIVKNLEDQGLTKAEAQEAVKSLSDTLREMVYGEELLTGNKKKLVDGVLGKMFDIFQQAADKYHSYAIELPMTVDTTAGAKVPTYAHETDAAADLYAMEEQTIKAHTYGNMIRTGVKIQLPEGWLAMILPRSSIGTKTPLRLSNSVGLIDSGYRGELGVLFDNTSTGAVEIKKGDRIAQLLVMPSYRFQPKVVESLEDSDRGEGGFGSTGT